MRTKSLFIFVFLFVGIILLVACKKSSSAGSNGGGNGGNGGGGGTTSGPTILKDASSVPIGVGVDYDPMKNNPTYSSLVKAQFDRVTAGYQMKHGA
ncbi:MAG TPA: hypothetical protein VET23_00205, partial [Chitinophagaceae bacterium]|nr:hypothetical protein [Chitinophagaceae bacterium]